MDQFLQRDLLQGHIYYQHSGDEIFQDSFDIRLSDSHRPPNLSHTYVSRPDPGPGGWTSGTSDLPGLVCLQTVVVHVFPVKDQVPAEVPGSVRALRVQEDEVVHVTEAQLHFTDGENPGAELTYVITRPCFSPVHPG